MSDATSESREPPPQAHRRKKRRDGLSVQSTVLIMLLSVSLLSNVLVGVIGYVNATDSLRDAAYASLTEVRDSRTREVLRLYSTLENSIVVHANSHSVVEATHAFTEAFVELADAELTEEQDAALTEYYKTVFAPQLAEATGVPVIFASFVPATPAQRYLQAQYTIRTADFDEAIAVTDAGDGSAWTAAHVQHHPYFREMANRLDYEDVLLLDLEGNVVYSAFKGVDLGTNVVSGQYRFTGLARAYLDTVRTNLLGGVTFTDFEEYPPSLASPAGWAVTPVSENGRIIGAMAVEVPIDRLAAVMTADNNWLSGGLGATGEVYLVGSDHIMRSPSRLLREDEARFAAEATERGISRETAELAVARGDTVGVVPVHTEAVEAALSGKTGTVIASSYLGNETIAAYGPLGIPQLDWVVVAEIESTEAFAPVADFTRNLVISSAVLALFVSVLSLFMARIIVRPMRRLADAAQRIAAGEVGVTVDAGSSDEMRRVSSAFNDMSHSLQVKTELVEKQEQESQRLLASLMPSSLIKKYRDGVATIAEDHHEVAVMYADIVGFDEFSAGLDSEHTLELLNELVRRFDEAAEKIGVEHVRTTTKGYLASCGLTVPRIDNARRILEFTVELHRILERFSVQNGASLKLRAGVDVGDASSGLVGKAHMAYDLWGDAVNLAFRVQDSQRGHGIFVTDRVKESVPPSFSLTDAGPIAGDASGGRVWRLEVAESRA
ncbi:MAG TPA: adenylate/guanylate cyclase domain-containing protein [Terrimesophilobacter sp.]|nr:adenylate/guanylate cyclase domain-containing protein [Terrimesophilobacter sp.]